MKRSILISILSLLLCVPGYAQDKHVVRVGWGDPLHEALIFHPSDGTSAYSYTGHVFTDYYYSITPVVSVGGEVDFQSVCWSTGSSRLRNYDLCFMHTVRFTFLRKECVRLHAGVGTGLLWAWDNEGVHEFAPVLNFNSIGVEAGKGHWWGIFDLGFMVSMKNVNHIYMFGSRLMSVGVNYRW